MTPAITLTRHAIERYIKRHARGSTFASAASELEAALPSAVKLKERATGRRGGYQWEIDGLGLLLITQLDPGATTHTCVTILPARTVDGFTEAELAILEDAEADRERCAALREVADAADRALAVAQREQSARPWRPTDGEPVMSAKDARKAAHVALLAAPTRDHGPTGARENDPPRAFGVGQRREGRAGGGVADRGEGVGADRWERGIGGAGGD